MKQKINMAFLVLVAVGMAILLNAPAASAQDGTPQAQAGTPTPTPQPLREVTTDEVNAVAQNLYCPICSNVPLDVCGTKACADWREEIRQKLEQGWSVDQINMYFSQRYGDRVLPVPTNPLVYIVPVVIVLAAAIIVMMAQRPRAKKVQAAAPAVEALQLPKDDPYIARLEAELEERKRKRG